MFQKFFGERLPIKLYTGQRSDFYYKTKPAVRCKIEPKYERTSSRPPVRTVYLWHDIEEVNRDEVESVVHGKIKSAREDLEALVPTDFATEMQKIREAVEEVTLNRKERATFLSRS